MIKHIFRIGDRAPTEPVASHSGGTNISSSLSQGVSPIVGRKAKLCLDRHGATTCSQIISKTSPSLRPDPASAALSATKLALKALYYSRMHRVAQPVTGGIGAIIMLHRLTVDASAPFAPNAYLKITPAFLDGVIRLVLDLGFDVISLGELHQRLIDSDYGHPFVSFTFDDGYRDNYELAFPIFKKYKAPFAIYVPSNFPDGNGLLWWEAMELVVSRLNEIELTIDNKAIQFPCRTSAEKTAAYNAIVAHLWRLKEPRAQQLVRDLSKRADVDTSELNRRLIMNWDEIRALDADTLVTIGAHTQNHFALAKLPESIAREEVRGSLLRITEELGEPPKHFAYPYGSPDAAGSREFAMLREAGVMTAVTTRKGMLFATHAAHMTALPRLSLNGGYQDLHYIEVLLSGLPFALQNRFRTLQP